MNYRKVTILGKDFIVQDKELVNPKIFEVKGLIKKPFCTSKRKLIFSISLAIFIVAIVLLCLIPVFVANIICLNNKCENNSTCTVKKTSYTCKCLNGFTGTYCENYDACWNNPCEGCQPTGLNERTYMCLCGIKNKDSNCITNRSTIARDQVELANGNIAVAYDDFTIRIWNDVSFENFTTLKAHNDSIKALTILQNGNLVSASCDGSIRIWNTDTLTSIQTIRNSSGCINSLVEIFVQNTQYLVSGGDEKLLKIWKLSSDSTNVEIAFTFNDHLGSILALDYNPHYQYLASGSEDKSIILWKLNQYEIIRKLKTPDSETPTALVILDDDKIVCGDTEGKITIYDSNNGSLTFKNHSEGIVEILVLDRNVFVSASLDSTIKLWRLNKNGLDLVKTLDQHADVTALIILKNKYLVSASSDSKIKIWNSKTFELVLTLNEHKAHVFALASSKSNDIWISASFDSTIKVWNQTSFKLIHSINNIEALISSVCILSNGNIAGAGQDGTITIWDKQTYSSRIIKEHEVQIVKLISFTNGLFAGYSMDRNIFIWNETTYSITSTLVNEYDILTLVASKNNSLISGSTDGTIKVWSQTNLKFTSEKLNGQNILPGQIKPSHDDPVTVLAFSKYFLISGSKDTSIRVWSLNPPSLRRSLNEHVSEITSLAICEQLCTFNLVSGSSDGEVNYWDDNHVLLNKTENSGRINSILILDNKKLLSFALSDGSIKFLSLNFKLNLISVLTGHTKSVQNLAISDNNIISCSGDTTIRIWNDEKLEADLTGHTDYIYALTLLSNNLLVSGSRDRSIKIWNISTKSLVKNIYAHEDSIICLTSFANNIFASGSCDHTIKIFNSTNVTISNIIYTLRRHRDCVNALTVFKKTYLISGSADKKILVWDINNKFDLVYTLNGHSDSVNALTILSDGSIASGSSDKSIKIWPFYSSKIVPLNEIITRLITLKNGNIVIGTGEGNLIIIKSDTLQKVTSFKAHNNPILDLIELPNENLVSTGTHDVNLKIWSKNNESYMLFNTLNYSASYMAVDLKHGLLLSACPEILIWNYSTFTLISNLSVSYYYVNSLSINDANQEVQLCAGLANGDLMIWRYNSHKNEFEQFRNLTAHEESINSILILSGGNYATGSSDSVIKIWNKDFEEVNSLKDHNDEIYSLALLPNGDLVSVSLDATIIVWEAKTLKILCVLTCQAAVFDIISVGNNSFISGGLDKLISKWDRGFKSSSNTILSHSGPVQDLVVLDKHYLLSASQDATIKIWDRYFNNLASEIAHSKAVLSLKITPDQNVISSSEDKTIKVWSLDGYTLNKTVYFNNKF